jgi:hypothetical protein
MNWARARLGEEIRIQFNCLGSLFRRFVYEKTFISLSLSPVEEE